MTPKVGHYLYATCAGADYGRVQRVGRDENDCPVVDIELFELDAIAGAGDSRDDEGDAFGNHPLTSLRVLPPDAKVILVDVQYKETPHGIECNTPGDGCYRCEKSFWLNDEPASQAARDTARRDQLLEAAAGLETGASRMVVLPGIEPPPGPRQLGTIAIQMADDPDAPPDSLTLEAFTLGIFFDRQEKTARRIPEPWDAWLALSHEERTALRREAWARMRKVPGMPLVPVGSDARNAALFRREESVS